MTVDLEIGVQVAYAKYKTVTNDADGWAEIVKAVAEAWGLGFGKAIVFTRPYLPGDECLPNAQVDERLADPAESLKRVRKLLALREDELNYLHRALYMLVKQAGGELRIASASAVDAPPQGQIEAEHNAKTDEIVLRCII